jgi:uncharacterized protein (TIGR00290 family)
MSVSSKRAAVLWTGGKDCNLALYEAQQAGYQIVALVTFMMGNGKFKAHPIDVMKLQAEALSIPYLTISVAEPYKESYEDAIKKLKEEYDICTLVTGDIAEVHGNGNWITDRSKPAGVQVLLPLWHLDRGQLLQRLFSLNFSVIFSCVKDPWFKAEWLGKQLNQASLNELRLIENLDLCGEQGEYHTLVLDGPGYDAQIDIGMYSPRKEDEIYYMELKKPVLRYKTIHVNA